MIDSRIPQLTITPEQPLTNVIEQPTVLVNDPVYLVNDPNALVGVITVASPDIKINSSSNSPNITDIVPTFKTDSNDNAPNTTIQIRD